MVRETHLLPDDLIYPVFVQPGKDDRFPIRSMPGQFRWTTDLLPSLVREIATRGIPALILFGLPEQKDDLASGAYDTDGVVQRAVRAVKDTCPGMTVVTDACLDEYTSHGHCGIIRNGEVDNDATLKVLARIAVSQAEAGADVIAPSDMMDGRVQTIRQALDESGHDNTVIMSYAAKYASGFYGPFRDAADCAPQFGNRRSYQLDPGNGREALREVALDVEEGADMIMIKPALAYLDIIHRVRAAIDLPLAAYNVSGEYAMVKAAATNGWMDERTIVLELLTSIKRAGADLILTYHACDVAAWLQETR